MRDIADEPVVRVERMQGVGWVILNRPGQINAINGALRRGAIDALDELAADSDIAVIGFRGEGARGFCAGADIKDQSQTRSMTVLRNEINPGWIERLDEVRKPTIAALHGYCLGGGLELAMACDIRIAAPNAQMGLPETGLGLIPGGGGTQRLPRIIGLGRALDLLLTGRRIDAEEALRIGLVSRVSASDDSLLEEAQALARLIADKPPTASAYVKEAARRGMETDLASGLKLEKDLFVFLMSTEDRLEAAAAFREKRAPDFSGK
jgi:enoyl-CoA hydratase/carnithine racemase